MLELAGIIYIIYTTSEIAREGKHDPGKWVALSLIIYLFVAFGLRIIFSVLFEEMGTEIGMGVSLIFSLLRIVIGIGVLFLLQDFLKAKIRLKTKEARLKEDVKRQMERLIPYAGEGILLNYDPDKKTINEVHSGLPNQAAVQIKFRGNGYYFYDDIQVINTHFTQLINTSQVDIILNGSVVAYNEIELTIQIKDRKNGESVEYKTIAKRGNF